MSPASTPPASASRELSHADSGSQTLDKCNLVDEEHDAMRFGHVEALGVAKA
jgi:hypothetical protein